MLGANSHCCKWPKQNLSYCPSGHTVKQLKVYFESTLQMTVFVCQIKRGGIKQRRGCGNERKYCQTSVRICEWDFINLRQIDLVQASRERGAHTKCNQQDVEIKRSTNLSNSCQSCVNFKVMCIYIAKKTPNIWATFERKCVT